MSNTAPGHFVHHPEPLHRNVGAHIGDVAAFVTAQIFWRKNRKPAKWRDAWQIEHTLGKYVISDKPMTEEQWTRERATLIDVRPDDEKKS